PAITAAPTPRPWSRPPPPQRTLRNKTDSCQAAETTPHPRRLRKTVDLIFSMQGAALRGHVAC
ncbi:MAG TPA: hypothetical protein PK777_16905, partial [Thermoguttaceae bacterium]|nr:hypothetical protein [Thermoguttaceae bacterium]